MSTPPGTRTRNLQIDGDDVAEVATDARLNRTALAVFVAVEIAAFVTYLVIGRFMWFYGDDWSVLAGRGWRDVYWQHGGHLIALPVLVFRAMYFVFGLRSYAPYLVMIVSLHVAVAALLRLIMRRAAVGPWIATAGASLYVFFGAGGQNTLWAFQITFVGAVALGLAQLVLADHDGPFDRRDWFGLGCGALALMCSGVAVTMVAVVGTAALIRGRWRAAVFHVVPLGVLWSIWSLRFGAISKLATSPTLLFSWDRRGIGAAFRSLGYVAPIGWAIAAILIAGLAIALRDREPEWRAHAAVPLAMLVGVFIFFTVTGASRATFGLQAATSSRYLDVAAVLLLPAVALAAHRLARWNRAFLGVVVALLLVGIPGNISQTRDPFPSAHFFRQYRQMMLSIPRMSLATRVPGSVHPDPNQAPTVTVSWLLDAVRSGRLPKTRQPTAPERLTNVLRLSLDQSLRAAGSHCRVLHAPLVVDLRTREAFSVRGRIIVRLVQRDAVSSPVNFGAGFSTGGPEHWLVDVGGFLTLRVSPAPPPARVSLCGLPSTER